MEYDPTQYIGAARYYLPGRPPYSAQTDDFLADELGLDGTGRLLDVGSGPGTLAVQLAAPKTHSFARRKQGRPQDAMSHLQRDLNAPLVDLTDLPDSCRSIFTCRTQDPQAIVYRPDGQR